MIRERYHLLTVFFIVLCTSGILASSCKAAQDEFDHVALLKCDQKKRVFNLIVLGKGNAKKILEETRRVEAIYLFNKHTIQFPNKYEICLVRIKDYPDGYRRKITWIKRDDPLLPQLEEIGLDKTLAEILAKQASRIDD